MGTYSNEPIVRNTILSAIPRSELQLIWPLLTRVRLVRGQVLYEYGEPIDDFYFIEEGLVSSSISPAEGEDHLEVDAYGRNGVAGLTSLLVPNASSFYRVAVQMPGVARRIATRAIRDAVDRAPVLRQHLLRAIEITQLRLSVNVACRSQHSLSERLARSLVMLHETGTGDTLDVTQEFLARMLAVRRPSITIAMGSLESTGVIHNRRGHIVVCDRAGLAAASCGCYEHLARHIASAGRSMTSPPSIPYLAELNCSA